jgi:hypothetical protein
MQVHMQPFPVNMVDFDDKKVLVWLDVADKDNGGFIIGDPRALDKNIKIFSREIMAEKTLS